MLIKALFFKRPILKLHAIQIFVLWLTEIGGLIVLQETYECRKEKEKKKTERRLIPFYGTSE